MKDVVVDASDIRFHLLDDPLTRLQRALRLMPRDSLGAPRRALLFALVTWLPVALWAAATGHLQSEIGDPLLPHLGVHVRCLLGIPLFILSEPLADRVMGLIVANFEPSGLLRPGNRSEFDAVTRSIERLRDSRVIYVVILAVVVMTAFGVSRHLLGEDTDALTWRQDASRLDFGGWWTVFVIRPLFFFMLLVWVWRLILTWVLFRRIARLDLWLVPSHPDRVAGLGFIEFHSAAFMLVVLVISSVVCAAAAHQILSHGVRLSELAPYLATIVVILLALFMAPLTAFSGKLRRLKLRAKFDYGTLAGRHVGGLHARWVEGHPWADESIMQAPEIGPAADVATLYDLANRIQVLPFGKFQIATLLVPALLPVLVVATAEIPLSDILAKLLGMLT